MIPEHTNLKGKRAQIIPLQKIHLNDLLEAGRNPDIWEHLQMSVSNISEMENFINIALANKENGTEFPFVVIDQALNKIVGSTRFLDIRWNNKGLEIGSTWLNPTVWASDFNAECKYLLLKFCFEELKLIRIQFKTDNLNLRSQKAILKLGASYEGTLRNHMIRRNGTFRHSVYFSIIVEEWAEIKSSLEKKLY